MRRFKPGGRAASALNHPNIITIHDLGEAESVHFIAMELIEGETLRDRLTCGAMSLDDVIDAGIAVAGLGAADEAGIIHRDIKPENMMVRPDGHVKILDFELAEPIAPIGTALADGGPGSDARPAAAAGTPTYMSPEQDRITAPLDTRTNLSEPGRRPLRDGHGHRALRARERDGRTRRALLHNRARPAAEGQLKRQFRQKTSMSSSRGRSNRTGVAVPDSIRARSGFEAPAPVSRPLL